MHARILVAGDDVAERGRAAHQFGDAGRLRIGRNDRQIGRAEGQIDQHDIGVLRQRARERDRGIGGADIARGADHGDAAAGIARLPQAAARSARPC